MSNAPVATAYTHAFVRAALPPHAQSILEIGCGNGELAERLVQDGFEVVALDADEACVAAAGARGLDARLAEWPADLGQTFDAVLFTRSLHHIHDVDGGLQAARRALRPGGRVIVEDFRAEGGSARGTDWYERTVRELQAGGALMDGTDTGELLARLPPAVHDGHELHHSYRIQAALEKQFAVEASDAAYYFRYVEPHLCAPGGAQRLLDYELKQIGRGEIDALGRRFIADPT